MKFNIWQALLVVAIIVILYLAMCRGTKTIEVPIVKTVTEQKDIVVADEKAINHVVDSMQDIQDGLVTEVVKANDKLEDTKDVVNNLHEVNDGLLAQLKSGELTTDLKDINEKLKANERRKDSLCNKIQSNLKSQLTSKSQVINEKDKLYKKLKTNFDTCLFNQTKLEKYIKDTKPRNKLAFGIVANVYPIVGIGIGTDFINKKGMVFSGNVMRMNKDWYVGIGFKKVISFR